MDFVQTPSCGYTLDYTFWIYDSASATYSALPSFITEAAKTFTVLSSSSGDVGSYKITVRGQVPAGYPAYQDELFVNLVVDNACDQDTFTPSGSPINSLTYLMDNDGLIAWSPTWTQLLPACPSTFEIGRIVTTVEQPLSAHETAALTPFDRRW